MTGHGPLRRLAVLVVAGMTMAATGCAGESLPQGDPVAGEMLVEELSPTCGQCHTLESAGFTGSSAPDLDEMAPGYQRVLDAVTEGPGFMPAYGERLPASDLQDIAAYVSNEAAG